uniref:Uncharacterized protein n=1 Tax=Anas platyrhynchos platyrhynchos TaxID=8840 RepID=A0A493TPB6_ANAPP
EKPPVSQSYKEFISPLTIAVWVPADNLGLCQHPTHILFDSNSFCKLHSQACSSHQQSPPGDCLSLTTHSRWKLFLASLHSELLLQYSKTLYYDRSKTSFSFS